MSRTSDQRLGVGEGQGGGSYTQRQEVLPLSTQQMARRCDGALSLVSLGLGFIKESLLQIYELLGNSFFFWQDSLREVSLSIITSHRAKMRNFKLSFSSASGLPT